MTQERDSPRVAMGTIFVAYGDRDRRREILEFAVEQAASCGHDLVVYHVHEAPSESTTMVRDEIERVVQDTDPYLVYDIEIERWNDRSGERAVSKQERLLDAIFESGRDYEYVVMGEIERGTLEGFTHSSMTEAVLKERAIPVVLVPI